MTMRTRVYLDPMSPDGKPGEVREMQYNEEDGVRSVMAPVPYTATAPATRAEMEAERDALLAEIPNLKGGPAQKADFRLRVLEREIRRALDMELANRRNAERVTERKKQQGRNSSFTGTMCELKAMVKAAGAAVAALAKAVPASVKKLVPIDWPKYLADFDDEQKQRALDMLASGDPQQKQRALEYLGRSGSPIVPAETAKMPAMPAPYAPAAVHAQNNTAADFIYRPVE